MSKTRPQFEPHEPGTISLIGATRHGGDDSRGLVRDRLRKRARRRKARASGVDRSFRAGNLSSHSGRVRSISSRNAAGRAALLGRSQFSGAAAAGCGPVVVRCGGLLRLAERNLRPEISPPYRSGMGARGARRRRRSSLIVGGIRRPKTCPITRAAGRQARKSSDFTRPTRTGYSTWAITCTNGAPIGTTPITMSAVLSEIRKGRNEAAGALREAAPGVTTSRCPDARRGRAFLLNSSTRTTVSAWRDLCEITRMND